MWNDFLKLHLENKRSKGGLHLLFRGDSTLLTNNRKKAVLLILFYIFLSRRIVFQLKNCSKSILGSKLETIIDGKTVKEDKTQLP